MILTKSIISFNTKPKNDTFMALTIQQNMLTFTKNRYIICTTKATLTLQAHYYLLYKIN